MLLLPMALIVYVAWKRARYFGNTAPLLIGALFFILSIASPDFRGEGFHLALMTFLFVFVAGVIADLLESRRGALFSAGMWGLLSAVALWNVVQLARLK